MLRLHSRDDDASLYRGKRLVPGPAEALEATFLQPATVGRTLDAGH